MNASKPFNFLEIFIKNGREHICPYFSLNENDLEIVKQLYAYFFNNKSMAEEYQLDLNKGVILAGPVGCGKTSLFRLFHLFSRNEVLKCKFKTHTCREVSFEYAISGIQTILDYSKGSFSAYDKTKPLTKLFDDLGTERSIKHFGTEMNIMTEILISRYEYFISHNMRTYITTNLGAKEIGEIYGERVQSRLREMCNFITFGGEMVDKRK